MELAGLKWLESASRRRRYLIGVSGGADSVALLHLLVRFGFTKLVVCHLDHQLRGRVSREDARFVGRLAKRFSLDFVGERADVTAVARSEGVSLETAGREARHQFFAECARRWRCVRLLLAHHADDQAETVLWNLLRGSRGASGMEETQELCMAGRRIEVIRPLLGIRRAELREWLTEEGIAWREDSTNAEPIATRNRLRNEVLPLLFEVARRDVVGSLNRAAESDAELREIETWAVEQAAAVDPQGRLHVGRIRELPEVLQRACVFAYLRSAGVSDLDRGAVERVLGMMEPGSAAKITLKGGAFARRRQGRIWIE